MEPSATRNIHPDLTWEIVGSALEVHRTLGPGLLEGTYRRCLIHDLQGKGLQVAAEVPIPISYKGLRLDAAYRADLIVQGTCLLELKAIEAIAPVHCLQTLTYLRLSHLPVGLLINFNVPRLKEGIRRFANA
jgi:GxxExxY protein